LNQKVSTNLYQKEWDSLENESTQPRFLRKIISTPYEDFSEKILGQNPEFVKTIVKSLYAGDAYVLKQAFPKKFLQDLVVSLHQYGRETPSSHHKMLDNCPDFHIIIDSEVTKKYTLRQIKHAYFFFHWNNDPFNIFKPINERWRVIKFLGGYDLDEYENNIPSDGVVDRIQFAQYPRGIGELELHSDPYLYQKFAVSGIMSKKGEDYMTGGAYILDKNREKIDIEEDMDIGDIYIVYPTVFHGVETIDKDKNTDWSSFDGRWFLGLYSNASDSNVNRKRHTCYGVEEVDSLDLAKIKHPH
jgi:hypothetical protein